jgi:hypothetical protein
MEIFEALVGLSEGCMCFLEFATLFLDGTTLYSGIQTYEKNKRAKEHDRKGPSWTPFIVLLVLAIFFTALMAFKYFR